MKKQRSSSADLQISGETEPPPASAKVTLSLPYGSPFISELTGKGQRSLPLMWGHVSALGLF